MIFVWTPDARGNDNPLSVALVKTGVYSFCHPRENGGLYKSWIPDARGNDRKKCGNNNPCHESDFNQNYGNERALCDEFIFLFSYSLILENIGTKGMTT